MPQQAAACVQHAPPGPPVVSGASVTRTHNGQCTVPVETTINQVTWSIDHFDNVNYKTNVVGLGSVNVGANDVGDITTFNDDTGNDSNIGAGAAQTSQYRIEIRRRSDNALMSSTDSNTLNFNTNRTGCPA